MGALTSGDASFATSYPDADPMRVIAKETATSSLSLLKTFNGRVESTTSQHKQLEALVRVYLAEIDGVEKDIKTTLTAAKVELDMYAKKLEVLQAKTGSGRDEAKIGRNLEKFETARAAYDAAVDTVTQRQKGIWEKRRVAFTALFCSFFNSQATAMSACMTTLSGTFAFVDGNQDALSRRWGPRGWPRPLRHRLRPPRWGRASRRRRRRRPRRGPRHPRLSRVAKAGWRTSPRHCERRRPSSRNGLSQFNESGAGGERPVVVER